MTTRGEAFSGLSVAIVTPFKNGAVDYDRLAEQVEFQVKAGTHVLCPVGTTGESPTLSHDEHEQVIAKVIEYAKGRIKIMPGTGSNSTSEALAADEVRPEGRRRRGFGRRPLLQQAGSRRLLSALQGAGRIGRPADLPLQHPRPHREERRARDDHSPRRTEEHSDGEGSDRQPRSGVADRLRPPT